MHAAEEIRPSPFVDPDDTEALREELESFFLVQLPTRLPNLVQQASVTSSKLKPKGEHGDSDAAQQQQQPEESKIQDAASSSLPTPTAEVATAPVSTQCFDNTMGTAIPGRLGKLVVYKSGKTVLVLQGPDGSPEVRSLASLVSFFGMVVWMYDCVV